MDLTHGLIPAVPLALQLAERLKLCDPLLLEMPEQEQALEPDWLEQLRACCREWEVRRMQWDSCSVLWFVCRSILLLFPSQAEGMEVQKLLFFSGL